VDLGVAAGGFDGCVCGGGDGEGDVFSDAAFVQGGFLGDEGEVRAVGGDGKGGYGLGVEEDGAGGGVVEAF
jgi:hypothetical protein